MAWISASGVGPAMRSRDSCLPAYPGRRPTGWQGTAKWRSRAGMRWGYPEASRTALPGGAELMRCDGMSRSHIHGVDQLPTSRVTSSERYYF